VELCLFDDAGKETRVDLPEVDGFRWQGYLWRTEPGQRSGFRVYEPWAPEKGQRCQSAKLRLDPYARAIEGGVEWDEAVFPYWFDNPDGRPNDRDSAPSCPSPR
jgi:glycogen operon protein